MAPVARGGGAARRILFVTSNGTGLGHLTRSLAIARRMTGWEPFFVTFSAAAPVVRELGYPVEYVASYDRPGAGTDLTWTLRARARLRAIVGELRPAVVAFDGTHPYERLLPALRAGGAPLVWTRRALWRDDADTAPLHRTHLFDAVLEPGEIGAGGERGPTAARRAEARVVDPIVLLERRDLLDRAGAERELGLEPGRRNVLVQLGQGPAVAAATTRALRRLAEHDVQVVAAASALAAPEAEDGVIRLHASYPVARYFPAFDAAIAAAGYNAAHELAALGVPALLVPMARMTDDQFARAHEAEAAGAALAVDGPDDPRLERRIDELIDPGRNSSLRRNLGELGPWRGAEQAAAWLADLATDAERRKTGHSVRKSVARQGGSAPSTGVRARRAAIFARTVPRTLWRVASQRATRPRARVALLALGLPPERHSDAVTDAIAAAGVPPEQVLVVTDHLDFAPLLAAGVGIEHIPAATHPQATAAGIAYDEFRRKRLDLILANRPRGLRVTELT